jgi:hypothetical protein
MAAAVHSKAVMMPMATANVSTTPNDAGGKQTDYYRFESSAELSSWLTSDSKDNVVKGNNHPNNNTT